MNDVVSFIFVNRGGKNLMDSIRNVQEVYSDYNKEIIVVEQADDKPFMRGQLFNIGVKYATGTYIALSDNDMYHLRKVPWIEIYENYQKPLIGFKWITQVDISSGKPVQLSTRLCPSGFGGFNFMKRSDFIGFNGFSNLFIRHGFEDNMFASRFDLIRIPQNLGHLIHPSRENYSDKNTKLNEYFYKNRNKFDKNLDGMKQTTYDLVSEEYVEDQIKVIKVNNISVCDNYAYIKELNKHYE